MLTFTKNDKSILFELCKLPLENLESYLDKTRNLTKISYTPLESKADINTVEVKLGSNTAVAELNYAELFQNGQNAWPSEPYFICRRVI